MAEPPGLAGTPPDGDPEQLVRVLTAVSIAAEFVVLMDGNPAAASTAGLLALTIRIALDLR
jgi:hypothetical protein